MNKYNNKWLRATLAFTIALASIMMAHAFKKNDSDAVPTKVPRTAVFQYIPPPSDPNPYSDANVKDTDNWHMVAVYTCSPLDEEEVPCSIEVPLENLLDEEDRIDALKVTISTSPTLPDHVKVNPNPSGGYTNPINRELF